MPRNSLTFLLNEIKEIDDKTVMTGRQDSADFHYDGRYCNVELMPKAVMQAKNLLDKVFSQSEKSELSSQGITLKAKGHWTAVDKPYKGRIHRDWSFIASDLERLPEPEIPTELKDFRKKVVDIVWEAVKMTDCHKSSEGALAITIDDKIYSWKNVFTEDPRVSIKKAKSKSKDVKIELFAYVLGPRRHHTWSGKDEIDAIEKASADLDKWIEEERENIDDYDVIFGPYS